jgi:hypothetical protein
MFFELRTRLATPARAFVDSIRAGETVQASPARRPA